MGIKVKTQSRAIVEEEISVTVDFRHELWSYLPSYYRMVMGVRVLREILPMPTTVFACTEYLPNKTKNKPFSKVELKNQISRPAPEINLGYFIS